MSVFRNRSAVAALVMVLGGCSAWNARHVEQPPVAPVNQPETAPRPPAVPPSMPQPPPVQPPASQPSAPQSPVARSPANTAAPRAARGKTPSGVSPGKAHTAPANPQSTPTSGTDHTAAPPALDLASLEQRLKDTHAIGVFTKLSLKNQVNDLIDQFRAFHRSSAKVPPPALRDQYDLLILKVLSLLQDADPTLAAAISSSREALWSVLKDPDKFAKI